MLSMVKRKAKILSTKGFDLLTSVFSSNESSFAFFICLLAIVFAYRVQLTVSLFTNVVRPFDFNPAQHSVWFVLAYLPSDLALVLVCFSLSWLLSQAASFIKETEMLPIRENLRTDLFASCFIGCDSYPRDSRQAAL